MPPKKESQKEGVEEKADEKDSADFEMVLRGISTSLINSKLNGLEALGFT